jgi:NAD(P)-dependent dehydrogenase (short-subunit alcohol dehydrogenase family)
MQGPLNEQVVVITGASSGIGRATALRFAKAGASVVLASRDDAALTEVAREIAAAGGRAHVAPTDVSSWEQVQALGTQAVSAFGHVDTWVNGAAVAVYATVEHTTPEEYEQMMRVNLLGVIHGTKVALQHMKDRGGTIINIGSVESDRALPFHSGYSATKHGVKGFTTALRLELKREYPKIQVTLILPTGINTPFFNHARSKIGTLPQPVPPAYPPELVADSIVYAAEHERRDIYVGGPAWMLAMGERISPALMDRMMMLGQWSFQLQKTNRPDDRMDNLNGPVSGSDRTHGDFASITKPSMYTPFFELTPTWKRVVLSSIAAGVALFALNRRHAATAARWSR